MFGKTNRFLRDQRGGVALIFALSIVPMVMFVGSAIDFSMTQMTRSRVAHALDSAMLAAATRPPMTNADLQAFITAQMAAILGTKTTGWSVDAVAQNDGTIDVTVKGAQPTTLMKIANFDSMNYNISAEVIRTDRKVELALVLDNTGSMNGGGKIGALRDAANALVDVMYSGEGAADNVRIALVPFVTSVNIRTGGFSMDWMDTNGDATWHGINFEDNPGDKVNHFHLFQQMKDGPGVSGSWDGWKGCVEARAEPYDLLDTPPDSGNPDTLWVPYFWPDEPDITNNYNNDYMEDVNADGDDYSGSGNEAERQSDEAKYGIQPPRSGNSGIDETPSSTSGPNKSCATPITPLTNNQALMKDQIDDMRGWNASGTNIALGMSWGWRVLSPTEPFTEGVSYDDPETLKAMVVLTDGENVVWGGWNGHNKSDYTGYGYLSNGRLESTDRFEAADFVNDKVELLCERIKDEGIRVYTITFKLNSSKLQNLFRECATESHLHFNSPSNSDLEQVFKEIAYDLSTLRLSR